MIYTIGFSNQDLNQFVAKLQHYGVQLVADVRSYPKSEYTPQFNQANLEQVLPEAGIGYRSYKAELGARPKARRLYNANGQLRFDSYRRTPMFQQGLQDILKQVQNHGLTVALACSEQYPWRCHRTGMVSRTLADGGLPVAHIMPDGSLLSNDAFEHVLVNGPQPGQGSDWKKFGLGLQVPTDVPFHRGDGILNEAYEKQNDVIGYQFRHQPAPTKSQPDRGPER